jgi:hypothetical protein
VVANNSFVREEAARKLVEARSTLSKPYIVALLAMRDSFRSGHSHHQKYRLQHRV